jgi:hypothetical protein
LAQALLQWGRAALGDVMGISVMLIIVRILTCKAIEYHQKRLKPLSLEIKRPSKAKVKALGDFGHLFIVIRLNTKKTIEYIRKTFSYGAGKSKIYLGRGSEAISNLGIVYHTLGNYTKTILNTNSNICTCRSN